MKPINVLSLFDGFSGGQIALERAGIPVANYYASEIDKYAIKVTQSHYPDTVQLGTVLNWESWQLPKIDLLLAGFPCQAYSNAGKGLGLEDLRGQLIYPMLKIIQQYKPTYFLLENVKGFTSKRHKAVYDFLIKELKSFGYDVHTNIINSALVSAQNRERLYITNFPVTQPEDKGILLRDIIEIGEVDREKSYTIDANYFKGGNPRSYFEDGRRQLVFKHQSQKRAMVRVGTANDINGHDYNKRIYSTEGKSPTLTAAGGNTEPKAALDVQHYRKLTPLECERLQTVDNIELSSTIYLCLDHQNPYVSVEIKNPKLLSSVGNVEKTERRGNVKYAEKNLPIKHLQTKKHVPLTVHINYEESKISVFNPEKSFIIVNGAKENAQYLHHREIKDFVQLLVGINTIVERIINGGTEECYLKEPHLIHQENGKSFVKLCGLGTTQLVKGVDLSIKQIKEILKYTTSDHFSPEKDEQTLLTLFSYVIHVINGYTLQKIQNYNFLTFEISGNVGWTSMVSNTQRYRCLGNGWTIDVIAHIFNCSPLGTASCD